jgi:hypothetical protein
MTPFPFVYSRSKNLLRRRKQSRRSSGKPLQEVAPKCLSAERISIHAIERLEAQNFVRRPLIHVAIDNGDPSATLDEGASQATGEDRFADAAFLVCDGEG